MAQDSIKNIVVTVYECIHDYSLVKHTSETPYSTNCYDVQIAGEICSTIYSVSIWIIVAILIAYIMGKLKEYLESKLRIEFKKIKEENEYLKKKYNVKNE